MRRFWLLLVLAFPLAAETDSRIIELQTAGYYELLDRARELGLPLTGGADDLRARVATALNLTLPPVEKAEGKTLTIDSAQEAGLVDVDAPGDGKLLRLSGGLQVTLVDHEKNVTHIVVADELWYDQANEEMTARGKVVYTMVRDSSKEVFRGESLTFRLSDSQGVFYGGASDRTRSVGDQALVFRYQGEAIRRSASDLVVLDSGTISSSLGADPYYRIRAKKIWVLAPGEWGMQDAVLYLGRIPVMYFPFFFQPGDEFFFNPVLSFPEAGDRRGTSLQTTTYVWGRKKKDTAPLSFLQLADAATDDERVQRGLFLVKGKAAESKVPENWTLRYLADFYSNLGFLTAVDVAAPGWLGVKNLTAFAGVGLTRTVDTSGSPFSLNPFDWAADPWAQSDWNGSWLGGTRLPFRWGGSFAFDIGVASASLEYYSDPLLYNDLTGSRSENFSVFSLLGLGPAKKSAVASAKSSLLWSASVKGPSAISGSLLWDTKTVSPAGPTGDPENTFYRPSQLTLPQVSATWSGTLWPLPASKSKPAGDSGLLPPDTPQEKTEGSPSETPAEAAPAEASSEDAGPSAPRRLDSRPSAAADPTWSTGATWSLRPTFKTDSRFDPKNVTEPSDPAWKVLTSRWTGSYDGTLGWNTGWSDGSLTASQTFSLRQQFQDTWYQGDSVTATDAATYRRQDLGAETGLLSQNFNSGWKPWANRGPLRDSALQYTLATKLWESKQQKDTYYDGTKDTVTSHQTSATAAWYLWEGLGSLKATGGLQTTLPPLDELRTWSSSLGLTLPLGTADTKVSAKQTEKAVTWNPWESNAEWKPWNGVSLRESFVYDVENSRPSTSTTVLKAGGFTAQYRHERTTRYTFNSDPDDLGWVPGEQAFLPRELSFSYAYNLPALQWWQYRNTLSSQLTFQWPINLQQYSNMPMSLNYTVSYKLHRFLDLNITEGIKNNTAYRYFPFLTDSFGGVVEPVNPLTDLWDAVSVWDTEALHRTGFKMTNLTVGLVHYLDDWVIKLDYTGAPELVGSGSNQEFQWKGMFTLLVQWYPVPELKTQMQVDKAGNLSILKNSP